MKELVSGLYAIAVPSSGNDKPDFKVEVLGIWKGKSDFDVTEYVQSGTFFCYADNRKEALYFHEDSGEEAYKTPDEAFNALILSKGFKESDKLVIIRKK